MLTYEQIQVRRAWVKALRSGQYRQTSCNLSAYEDEGRPAYCCLGVLCDVVDPHNAQQWRGEQMPPPDLEQAAGLGPTIDEAGNLAELNDVEGWSFLDIARYIEEWSC